MICWECDRSFIYQYQLKTILTTTAINEDKHEKKRDWKFMSSHIWLRLLLHTVHFKMSWEYFSSSILCTVLDLVVSTISLCLAISCTNMTIKETTRNHNGKTFCWCWKLLLWPPLLFSSFLREWMKHYSVLRVFCFFPCCYRP